MWPAIIVWCLVFACVMLSSTIVAQHMPEPTEIDAQSSQSSHAESMTLLSLGAIMLGLGLLGGLRFYRHVQFIRHPEQLHKARQQLLLRIANLDDRYAQGRIRHTAYQRKRARLKQHAIILTLQGMTEND